MLLEFVAVEMST